jgi:hypothetical protein
MRSKEGIERFYLPAFFPPFGFFGSYISNAAFLRSFVSEGFRFVCQIFPSAQHALKPDSFVPIPSLLWRMSCSLATTQQQLQLAACHILLL